MTKPSEITLIDGIRFVEDAICRHDEPCLSRLSCSQKNVLAMATSWATEQHYSQMHRGPFCSCEDEDCAAVRVVGGAL